jgi:hypothetical protein
MRMNMRSVLVLAGTVALGALAWRAGGWRGIVLLVSGLALWVTVYVTRVIAVMKRAADRPVGHIDSAVMFNSQLKVGQQLLHVLALTRSLGQLLSEAEAQPEVYGWRDAGGSRVTAEFEGGRLTRWRLERPGQEPSAR